MKQALAAPEELAKQAAGERRVVGMDCIGSKAAAPVSITVLETAASAEMGRNCARRMIWHQLIRPALGNIVLFGCLMGLFSLYCLSCIGRAFTFRLRKNRPGRWRMSCQLGLAVLFTAGLIGCVGYVGPGPGPVYGGPYFDGPDFYVFGGGYHGHYVGAFSHRGAVSRGFAGHGHHR
jgi:hypothetical protein